jgi:8-oxo-dGTP pyrophosphatase MutT (NUDIX family)
MAEFWDLVDENGNDIGIKWERTKHRSIPAGTYHRCVEVWVRVGDKLLVTQRHPEKSEGLCFDVPGGAVVSGEDLLTGAVREIGEEVGIKVTPEQLIPLGEYAVDTVYVGSYILRLPSLPELKLQESEVVDYRLVTQMELDYMLDDLTKGTRRRYLLYSKKIFE